MIFSKLEHFMNKLLLFFLWCVCLGDFRIIYVMNHPISLDAFEMERLNMINRSLEISKSQLNEDAADWHLLCDLIHQALQENSNLPDDDYHPDNEEKKLIEFLQKVNFENVSLPDTYKLTTKQKVLARLLKKQTKIFEQDQQIYHELRQKKYNLIEAIERRNLCLRFRYQF